MSRLPLLCECDDDECEEYVPLTLDEYEAARGKNRYLTYPGHRVAEDDATAV